MNTPPAAHSSSSTALRLDAVVSAIAEPTRWAILSELSLGEALMVKELGQRTGRSASLISKHMAVLRRAGIVTVGRGNLYRIAPAYLVSTEKRHVDLGHCLLRLPGADGQPMM